jgi:hypothetical protein
LKPDLHQTKTFPELTLGLIGSLSRRNYNQLLPLHKKMIGGSKNKFLGIWWLLLVSKKLERD